MGKEWRKRLKPYAQANHRKAWFQILNTVVPYFVLLGLMGTTIIMGLPYWLTFFNGNTNRGIYGEVLYTVS